MNIISALFKQFYELRDKFLLFHYIVHSFIESARVGTEVMFCKLLVSATLSNSYLMFGVKCLNQLLALLAYHLSCELSCKLLPCVLQCIWVHTSANIPRVIIQDGGSGCSIWHFVPSSNLSKLSFF